MASGSSQVDLLCHRLGLVLLPPHLHVLGRAIGAFFGIQILSRILSPRLFPKYYPNLSSATKLNWDTHVVAWFHSFFAVSAAVWMLWDEKRFGILATDKVFGFQKTAGDLMAVSTGYFAWDFVISTYMWAVSPSGGFGFFMHGFICVFVFLCTFRPFLQYFGAIFLLWEVSTLFLNPHWFMDKIGLTGSKLQVYNGVLLLITFFYFRQAIAPFSKRFRALADFSEVYRLIYGALSSYRFFTVTQAPGVDERAGFFLVRVFWILNIAITLLNVFWFTQMIKSVAKRMRGGSKKGGAQTSAAKAPSAKKAPAGGRR